MPDSPLLVKQTPGLLQLTINRPAQRNALNLSLLDEIAASLAKYVDDNELRCAVITGSGEKCFAAGGDLKELDAIRTDEAACDMSRRARLALDSIRQFPLPVIAGLNGLALGGGAELAMACDLRVASTNAEIGFLQAQLNLTTAWGGGIDLIAALGAPRALEILLSSRRLGADEAFALGLINRVTRPDETLSDCIDTFIEGYLARSVKVMRGFKALMLAHRRHLHQALSSVEENHFVAGWVHEDHWNAVAQAENARKAKSRRS